MSSQISKATMKNFSFAFPSTNNITYPQEYITVKVYSKEDNLYYSERKMGENSIILYKIPNIKEEDILRTNLITNDYMVVKEYFLEKGTVI